MTARYLLLETRRAYRNRRFLIFTVAMPLVFFLVFAGLYGDDGSVGGVTSVAYLMTSMASLGAMIAAMSSGTRIAVERQTGWNRQLRLTPLTPASYLVAKGIIAMLLAVPAILLVFGTGLVLEHVHLTAGQWAASGIGMWLAVVPFAVLGMAIGYAATPDSAQSLFSLTFMTFSLLGGIWIPVENMPHLMANLAKLVPSYWLGLIGRGPLSDVGFNWTAVPVLIAWTVVVGLLVMRRYQRDTQRA